MIKFLELILTNQTLKAWVAALSAAGAALTAAVQDGLITGAEFGTIVGAFAVALGLVYRVPNGKASE